MGPFGISCVEALPVDQYMMGIRGRLTNLTKPRDVLPNLGDAFDRAQRPLPLAAFTGLLTGLGVAAFEWTTRAQIFARITQLPLALQAGALIAGLALTALALRYVGHRASPATSDEYIRNFHDPERPMPSRPVLGRLLAGAATLGTGGALGYEGPSIYIGAALGTSLQKRFPRWFERSDNKMLMVAGAAAGVAAIFKAPTTGAIFALEVPYQDDTARHLLLPALVGSASGYLAFAAIFGTRPLFSVRGLPPFELRELLGAAILGLACGLGARVFAWILRTAKRRSAPTRPVARVAVTGVVLALLAVGSYYLFGDTLSVGSGYRTLAWVTEPGHSIPLVLALLAFRVLATTATVAGGGVGGLFIPLVTAGALLGEIAQIAIGEETNLFPLIGVAAFLGAGYRTPLAGVVFVAEATGRPGYIVPGLIASVAAQLVMGDVSVSEYQIPRRRGHLERQMTRSIGSAIRSDVATVPPDMTLREFSQRHLGGATAVPVIDSDEYVGMISSADLRRHPIKEWDQIAVIDVCHTDWPRASLAWRLEDAALAMDDAPTDSLPVLDDEGRFCGIVTNADIVRLEEFMRPDDD